jgi:Holliday junction resolvase
MTPTHASLIRELVHYLELRGWYVIQTPAGGITGEPGVSDLLAFKAKRTLFVEAKVGRDKLSAKQIAFKADVTRQGFEYLEPRSLDDILKAGI